MNITSEEKKEILLNYEIAKKYIDDINIETYITLDKFGLLEEDLENWKEIKANQERKESAAKAGLDRLRNRIKNPNNYISITSGFKDLDRILDGGFYSGLYVIGAISSLGKTSFAVNLADNAAKSGRKVIYISLEMAEEEIIAKSISRLTYDEASKYNTTLLAKDTRHILNGKLWDEYSQDEKQIIENAIEDYKEYADNIFIYEGVGSFNSNDIREIVKKHADINEMPPIVIIDYLQILAPLKENITDAKKNMDQQIVELKRISRDFNTPIIAISSFNRSSYSEGVSFSALKESGAIEYTADVVIGLQYDGIEEIANDERKNDKEQKIAVKKIIEENEALAYRGEQQRIQIKLLKNRNGTKGSVFINYMPKYNYFWQDQATTRKANEYRNIASTENLVNNNNYIDFLNN